MRKRPEPSLRNRALQYLARREYSRAELSAKLLSRTRSEAEFDPVEPASLDTLLDELTELGWLSDERAAKQLVHAKRKRFGTQRITSELRRKGITESLIEAALPALRESELEAARGVWKKKFGSVPQDAKEKSRQMRFLQSRGFSVEVIFKVFQESVIPAD